MADQPAVTAPRTRSRQAITRAVEAAGCTVERITYEPSSFDGDQVVGGWEVLCTDGHLFVGENVQVVLADIEAEVDRG